MEKPTSHKLATLQKLLKKPNTPYSQLIFLANEFVTSMGKNPDFIGTYACAEEIKTLQNHIRNEKPDDIDALEKAIISICRTMAGQKYNIKEITKNLDTIKQSITNWSIVAFYLRIFKIQEDFDKKIYPERTNLGGITDTSETRTTNLKNLFPDACKPESFNPFILGLTRNIPSIDSSKLNPSGLIIHKTKLIEALNVIQMKWALQFVLNYTFYRQTNEPNESLRKDLEQGNTRINRLLQTSNTIFSPEIAINAIEPVVKILGLERIFKKADLNSNSIQNNQQNNSFVDNYLSLIIDVMNQKFLENQQIDSSIQKFSTSSPSGRLRILCIEMMKALKFLGALAEKLNNDAITGKFKEYQQTIEQITAKMKETAEENPANLSPTLASIGKDKFNLNFNYTDLHNSIKVDIQKTFLDQLHLKTGLIGFYIYLVLQRNKEIEHHGRDDDFRSVIRLIIQVIQSPKNLDLNKIIHSLTHNDIRNLLPRNFSLAIKSPENFSQAIQSLLKNPDSSEQEIIEEDLIEETEASFQHSSSTSNQPLTLESFLEDAKKRDTTQIAKSKTEIETHLAEMNKLIEKFLTEYTIFKSEMTSEEQTFLTIDPKIGLFGMEQANSILQYKIPRLYGVIVSKKGKESNQAIKSNLQKECANLLNAKNDEDKYEKIEALLTNAIQQTLGLKLRSQSDDTTSALSTSLSKQTTPQPNWKRTQPADSKLAAPTSPHSTTATYVREDINDLFKDIEDSATSLNVDTTKPSGNTKKATRPKTLEPKPSKDNLFSADKPRSGSNADIQEGVRKTKPAVPKQPGPTSTTSTANTGWQAAPSPATQKNLGSTTSTATQDKKQPVPTQPSQSNSQSATWNATKPSNSNYNSTSSTRSDEKKPSIATRANPSKPGWNIPRPSVLQNPTSQPTPKSSVPSYAAPTRSSTGIGGSEKGVPALPTRQLPPGAKEAMLRETQSRTEALATQTAITKKEDPKPSSSGPNPQGTN